MKSPNTLRFLFRHNTDQLPDADLWRFLRAGGEFLDSLLLGLLDPFLLCAGGGDPEPLLLAGGDPELRPRLLGDPDPLRLGGGEAEPRPRLLGGGEPERFLGGGEPDLFRGGGDLDLLLGGGDPDLLLRGGDPAPRRLGDTESLRFLGGGLLESFLRGAGLPEPRRFGLGLGELFLRCCGGGLPDLLLRAGEALRRGGGLADTLRLSRLPFLFCLGGGGLALTDRLCLRFGGGEPLVARLAFLFSLRGDGDRDL